MGAGAGGPWWVSGQRVLCSPLIKDPYSSDGDVFTMIDHMSDSNFQSGKAYTSSNARDDEEWILDSVCTYHMSPNRRWFRNY